MEATREEGVTLTELQMRFDAWRDTRPHARAPFPDDLWIEAALLAESLPVSHVAQALRVNPTKLKQQIRLLKGEVCESHTDVAGFVKTSLDQLQNRPSPSADQSSWRLVLERPDGTQLKLGVPRCDHDLVLRLARSLLG